MVFNNHNNSNKYSSDIAKMIIEVLRYKCQSRSGAHSSGVPGHVGLDPLPPVCMRYVNAYVNKSITITITRARTKTGTKTKTKTKTKTNWS